MSVESSKQTPSFLRQGLWLISSLALLVLWSGTLLFSNSYYQRLFDDSRHKLEQMNGMVAQHAQALFQTIETDLHIVDHWLQNYRGHDPLNDPLFLEMLSDLRSVSRNLIDLRFVSGDGKLYYAPSPQRKALADVSDRQYYLAQRGDGPRQLYIDDPVLSRVTGKWVIPVSWRLRSPVAGLEVVFAAVELERLTAPHERWRFKDSGSILLLREDGILLSRAPFDPQLMGRDLSGGEQFDHYRRQPRGSLVFQGIKGEGVPRLVSFERLEGFPLYVVVTREVEEALGGFKKTRLLVMAGLAVFSLCILGFTLLLHRAQETLFQLQRELRHQAMTDELTQVMNRRALIMQLERELARARRQAGPLALLLLDIDRFKQINDTAGHAIGDQVLSRMAACWRQALRGQDLLGRVGGEEFCVILPDTGPEAALEVAERLRLRTREEVIETSLGPLVVSVSIGVTCLAAGDADWQALSERADRALYQAKTEGRNRVVWQGAEAEPPP